MKKKIISFFLSMVAILSVCTVIVSAEYHFVKFTSDTGNIMSFSQEIPNWRRLVLLARGDKSFLEREYSGVNLNTTGTVNKAECWMRNYRGEDRSAHVIVYPGKGTYQIKYDGSYAFGYGERTELWAKQDNVLSKKANGEFYAH